MQEINGRRGERAAASRPSLVIVSLLLVVEGLDRDFVEQTYVGFNGNFSSLDPTPVGMMQSRTYGGWSTLANVWA